jgi:zinc transport system ATP-binding protein
MGSGDRRGPKIECVGVSLVLGANLVLKNINLTVEAGTIHSIIGPNGGGKSSFVKTLLGRMRHTGTIALHWADADRTIGYVPQIISVDKSLPLSVRDFMTLCVQDRPAVFGMKKRLSASVAAALSDVKMADKQTMAFADLSGGERQRVMFAQALVPAPRLLILDEPASSVDRAGTAIIAGMVTTLAERGTTIVWVHHDFSLVRELATTVSCINQGMVFSGSPAEVMDEKHLFEIFSDAGGA